MACFWGFSGLLTKKNLCVPQLPSPIVYVYKISELCDKFQILSVCGGFMSLWMLPDFCHILYFVLLAYLDPLEHLICTPSFSAGGQTYEICPEIPEMWQKWPFFVVFRLLSRCPSVDFDQTWCGLRALPQCSSLKF